MPLLVMMTQVNLLRQVPVAAQVSHLIQISRAGMSLIQSIFVHVKVS
jgi:hypothetical protein